MSSDQGSVNKKHLLKLNHFTLQKVMKYALLLLLNFLFYKNVKNSYFDYNCY